MSAKNVQVKRIYEDESSSDGTRVLVDRLWPRGVSKERADLAEWDKEVAPSNELRKWYGHDPAKFDEFKKRYKKELNDGEQKEAFQKLKEKSEEGPVTLLTASKAVEISEAQVLKELLTK